MHSNHKIVNYLWCHRFAGFVWWVSARYFTIGLEYAFEAADSAGYWNFGNLPPCVVGWAMVLAGLSGILSRMLCLSSRPLIKLSMCSTFVFAGLGVALSLFRVAIMVQDGKWGDPLLVLFVCDAFGILNLLFRMHRPANMCYTP
jgi:hypothetical protein